MNRALKLLVATVILFGSAGMTAAAWAYFTTSGAGVGTGSTGTLAAPTNVLAPSPAPGATTVAVSWTPPVSPDGSALKGFYVERLAGASASAACGSTTSPPPLAGTAISCNDTGVASGTYTYRVTAYWRSWTATSAPSNATTVSPADTTPPSVAVTFPANNGAYTTSSFDGGCSPVGICGTASDQGSGVASVSVSIRSGSNYWTGNAFSTTIPTFVPVTSVASGTGTWKYTFAAPAAGSYVVQARAIDNVSNIGTSVANTFVIDNTPPTVTINQAAGQVDPTSGSTVHFTAIFSESVTGFDNTHVTRGGTATGGNVTVTPVSGTNFDIAIGALTGNGTVTATIPAGGALDAAGNLNTASTSTDNTVTFDTAAPAAPTGLTLTSATDTGSSTTDGITKNNAPTFTGTAEASSTITLFNGATQVGIGVTNGTGTFTAAVSPAFVDATYAITAKATDAAGNTSGSSLGKSITIDTVAPSGLTITASGGSGHSANASGNAGHATHDVLSVTVVICATNSFPCTSPEETKTGSVNASTGAWTTTGASNLGNNSNHFAQLAQADTAGNSSTATSTQFAT